MNLADMGTCFGDAALCERGLDSYRLLGAHLDGAVEGQVTRQRDPHMMLSWRKEQGFAGTVEFINVPCKLIIHEYGGPRWDSGNFQFRRRWH